MKTQVLGAVALFSLFFAASLALIEKDASAIKANYLSFEPELAPRHHIFDGIIIVTFTMNFA